VLGILILVIMAIGLGFYFRSEQAYQRYERRLLAAGEKLKVSDWLPAPPPDGKNGAMLFRQVIASLPSSATLYLGTNGPHAMKMCAPGKAIVGWAQPNVSDEIPTSWSEELEVFDQVRPGLEELEKLTERPWLDFDLDYYQGFTLLLPHLSQAKTAVQQLAFATVFDLHQKDLKSAARRIHLSLTLAEAMRREPLVISQLVRVAIEHINATATWELLQFPEVPDGLLADLQRHWAAQEFASSAESALGMERAMARMTAEQMRTSSSQFRRISSGAMGASTISIFSGGGPWYEKALAATTAKSRETLWRMAFSYPDQLRAMKGQQALIESVRMVQQGEPFEKALESQTKKLLAVGIERAREEDKGFRIDLMDPELSSLFSNSVRSLERFIIRVFKSEVTSRLTTTAVALKRYKLAHGTFPESLDALVPKYLTAVPLDPADGKPLRYRLEGDGSFKMYSIGEDGVDNGGDSSSKENGTSFSWQMGRDLVWPKAATPEEALGFQQSQAERKRKR
jgi:hypothetical protein